MGVQLLAIKFNHGLHSAAGDALNIRKNASTFVDVPEWRRGVTTRPEDSVAAYAVREIADNPVTVQARFACVDRLLPSIEVRAVQPPLPWPGFRAGCIPAHAAFWRFVLETQANVLGELRPRQVTFRPDGSSNFESFDLVNHRLSRCGVNLHRVVWQWQYRIGPASPWTQLERTRHQIYTVLATPAEPWIQQPYHEANVELPWTDVLEHACRWARLARTPEEAAGLITHRVHDLGKKDLLEYGCPLLAPTVYAFPYFRCTEFLKRLQGDIGLGQYCNCTDCATIVSTFSNALGCELSQSRMQTFGTTFPVNPIRAIGLPNWDTPCGLGFFGYHEVAWTGACTENDNVFDACLEVDRTAPPYPPYTALLPVNLRFGSPGERVYRDLLAAPWGRNLCEAQPSTQQRRRVVPGPPRLTGRAARDDALDHLRRSFSFDAWAGTNRLDENLFILNSALGGDELPGWRLRKIREFSMPDAHLVIQSLWQPGDEGTNKALRIDLYECSSRLAAHAFLLQILAEFELPGIARRPGAGPGDVAFVLPGDTGVVFSRANVAFRVLNAGSNLVALRDLAEALDADVVSRPEQGTPAQIIPEWHRSQALQRSLEFRARLPLFREVPTRALLLKSIPHAGAAAARSELRATLKFFSPTGAIRLEDGIPVYEPEKAAPHRILVVATTSERTTFTQNVELRKDEGPSA